MNVFQIKTKPHGIERIQEFLDKDFVCIGWPKVGNLDQVGKDELRDRLARVYQTSGHKLGNILGQVNCFVNTIRSGDIILITDKNWAHIGVLGDYDYQDIYDNEDDGMCHRRPVEWKAHVKIDELEASVQQLLKNRNTICQFPDPIETSGLEKHLNKQTSISKPNSTRLNDLFEDALNVLEDELKSSDPDRRLKAATELLRLKQ